MTTDCDVLILAAHRLELRGLLPLLGEGLSGVVSGKRVICADVGVGPISAAVGTVKALANNRPRGVVLIGSYGYFPQVNGAIGELSALSEARLTDAQVLAGAAAIPEPMPHTVQFHQELTVGIAAVAPCLGPVAMATTLAITESDALASELGARSGCRGENLEAFAVGHVVMSEGVPCAALLGATNRVGSEGRAQWRAHHGAVAEATADLICRFLAQGAQGLPG